MLVWSVAVLVGQFLVFFRPSSVLSFGVPFLLCRPIGLAIWVLITSMLLGLLVGCWIRVVLISLCRWLKMGFGRSCSVHDLY